MTDRLMRFNRRQLLVAGAASAALPLVMPSPAQAQPKPVVVGNWGGDWHTRINRIFEKPFEAKGYAITHDFGNGPDRKTKLVAQRNLPRGSMDIAHLVDNDAYEMNVKDTLDALDASKIPNWNNIYPTFRTPYYIPYVVAAFVVVYNPEKIIEVPTSFNDMLNPKYAGRVGLVDQTYYQYIMAASLAAGGTVTNVEPGFKKLLDLKKAVQPRIYPAHEQTAAAFKNGEIWITMNYVARALQWSRDGIAVKPVYPKEGTGVSSFGLAIPKRARDKDAAYAYLNQFLDPQMCGEMCTDSLYAPAINNAVLPANLKDIIDYPRAHLDEMKLLDYEYSGQNVSKWLDWWNKEMKG
jgi:putative spermidine/putrescine transport system substrate-binding protein